MRKGLIFGFVIGMLIVSFISGVYAIDSVTGTSQEETKNALSSQEAEFLQTFESWGRVLFNLGNEEVTFQYLIVLIALFIVIVFVISNVLEFVPIFSGWTARLAGIVIVLLISVSGGIRIGALFLMGFQNMFGEASALGKAWFALVIVIVIIIGWGFMAITNKIGRELNLEKKKSLGRDVYLKSFPRKAKREGAI